jgi:hypothetical protein
MRYRWDPVYPGSRRDWQAYDASMRASDEERNAVADKLSRHYAEGRLDESEFKTRLDAAMSATTRGELNGLFHDLPKLPAPPPPPPTRRQRSAPWLILIGFVAFVSVASIPWWPLYHVPWFLFAVAGFLVWRASGSRHHHQNGGSRPNSVMDQ